MNLLQIQNRINELMARWVASLKGAASMSRTDLNLVSETILVPLLREVYGWPDLRNLNTESANFPGIDLADDNACVAIQVTSTANSTKVKHTLSEFVEHELFEQYDQLIVYILVEKQKTYGGKGFDEIIGGRFTFDKKRDIRDYRDLLAVIQDFQIERAKRVLDILEANFGDDAQPYTAPTAALVLPLPADLRDFTGRQAQIQRVREQLDQQGIVAINGMGGMGKTALAVHVARQLIKEDRFSDAQLYIDLKGADPNPVDPADALDSLLSSIQKPDPDEPAPKRPRDLESLQALWQEAIESKDAILILDNAADATQVQPLLPGCPTCAVLVTSRRRFTLPGAELLDLRRMGRNDARRLLQELASRLEDYEADAIAKLCGALPLALRIAGNYLKLNDDVTPEKYAAMLAGERTRLAQLRDPDHPGLDVYATISLSVSQLAQDTRCAWAFLSLFPAPFDLPAAAALWDEPDEDQARPQLQALRNRSLVTYDPGTTRFHQHDLVRLAAARELEALPEQESYAAHLRLARHYEQVSRETNRLYQEGGDNVLQALALFDLEWPHIRSGQAWAAAHAEADDEAARLCSSYANSARDFLSLRLHPDDQIAWLKPALQAARRLGDQRAEGYHLGNLGSAYRHLGETQQAIDYYQQALEIARKIGDRRGEGARLGNLGVAFADRGEMHQARDYYQQALEIAREIGDRRGEGDARDNLGSAYRALGDSHKAIEHHAAALEILKKIGDRRGESTCLGSLGVAYADLGETHRAIDYYQQALAIAKEIGNRRGEGIHLGNLGLAYRHLGETRKAIDHCRQALAIAKETGSRRSEGIRLGDLGLAFSDLGETRKAIDYYQQALEIARETPDWRSEGNALVNLGSAYRALGETHKAIDYYQQALEISREIGDRRGEGRHLGNLGLAYADLGETQQTIEYHQQALEIAREISREIGDRRGEGEDLGNLGLAYATLGETNRAIDYYQQALEISKEIGDRRGEGNGLGNLGNAYATLGETNRAIDYYQQALEIAKEIGDRRGEGNQLGNLGNAYAALGETHQAIDYLHRALSLGEMIHDPVGVVRTCYNLACGYALQRDPEQALPYLRRALAFNSDEYCHLTTDDTDFDAIRDEPGFQALLAEFCSS